LRTESDSGNQILEEISKAHHFNKWMYETIRPFCRGNILEIGSGIGNISSFFISDNYQITLSDIRQEYLIKLKETFGNNIGEQNIISIDLVAPSFSEEYQGIARGFETVIFLNVLEHVENDNQAIKNCQYLLKPNGTLIILVPAYNFLYSQLDKALGHHRRYAAKRLSNLISLNGFTTKKVFYFNALGMLAWSYGKIFRLHSIPGTEMKVYDRLVPFAKRIDKLLHNRIGLSVIIIGENNSR
jgi:SAM-dependent methyltransferase